MIMNCLELQKKEKKKKKICKEKVCKNKGMVQYNVVFQFENKAMVEIVEFINLCLVCVE